MSSRSRKPQPVSGGIPPSADHVDRAKAAALLASLESEEDGIISRAAVQDAFECAGLLLTDPRIQPVMGYLRHLRPDEAVDRIALWKPSRRPTSP